MSELDDALDWAATNRSGMFGLGSHVAVLAKAARRVANLNMEAATETINRLRYIETGDEWDDKLDDIVAEAVNDALGITTGDD